MQMIAKSSYLTIVCIAGALLITGCADHLERKDTITAYAGDAAASNIAIHSIDPVPRKARYRHIHHDGTRMINAIDKYHEPREAKTAPAPKISNF